MSTTPSSVKSHIHGLAAALRIIRERTNDRVELQTVLALLSVAQHGETSASAMQKNLGITSGAASRTVARLSDAATRSGQGYGLVTYEEDWQDRRNKIIKLSAKGQQLMTDVTQALRRHTTKES